MSHFTKRERKAFYKGLLKMVCDSSCTDNGFCWYLDELGYFPGYLPNEKLFDKYVNIHSSYLYDVEFMEEQLPELWAIKPKDKHGLCYWWPETPKGWQIRINKLHNIIQRM